VTWVYNTSEHAFSFAKTFVQRDSLNQGQLEFGSKGTVERLEYLGNTQLNQASRLVYGLDWEQESITSADQSRIKRGYYLEYQNELLSNGLSFLVQVCRLLSGSKHYRQLTP
jgi:vitamin B12 transporter